MIEDLVSQIETTFAELGEQMTAAEVITDRERYAEVGRSYRALEPAARLAEEWRSANDDAELAQELLAEDGEDQRTREELARARERIEELEEQIRLAMVERDPNDAKNVIVEIQGGAGGEEAGQYDKIELVPVGVNLQPINVTRQMGWGLEGEARLRGL